MKHWKYLKYLLRHKWYVAVECWKCGLYIHAFTHDLSKFRPFEWFDYANYFYGKHDPLVQYNFNIAWLKHQHRNKHHWQYWVLHEDEGATKKIEMPYRVVLQMACDWIGASKAIRGKDAKPSEWYAKVKGGTIMNANSRKDFEQLIGYSEEP
jgi:hypothetical protein